MTDMLPLLREMNDLKRVRVASRKGSLAAQLFFRAWGRLARGEQLSDVAATETARAVVAVRLGGIDANVLSEAGLNDEEVITVLERAFDEVMSEGEGDFAAQLKTFIRSEDGYEPEEDELPEFARLLARQPRAGEERGLVEPEESVAEHCAVTAVNSYLAASLNGASPERAFLMGLCHRIHNAYLPDSGDAGNLILGDKLNEVVAAFRSRSVAELPMWLQGEVRASLEAMDNLDTPETKAFRASDSLDRGLTTE